MKLKQCTYLSVNIFRTKVLIGETIFTSPASDGTAILRGHPSHGKVKPLAEQREYRISSNNSRPSINRRPETKIFKIIASLEKSPSPPLSLSSLSSRPLPVKLKWSLIQQN